MFPVKTSNIASLIVLGTLCSGSNLFWFTEPRNKMLTSNKANEFNYCGRPSTRRYGMRIVNGVAASRNEYPWVAKLLVDYLTVGAGSLITDRHILTAAHCLIFYNERAFTETMHMYDCTGRGNVSAPLLPHCPESGSINKNYEALPVTFFSFILGSYATVNLPSDKVHQTLSYVIHPHFDIFKSSSDIIQVNDIAIVTIAPVTFSNKILPICLPLPNEAIPNWWNVTVAGWGTVTDYGDVPYQKQSLRSVVLMKTSLTHIPFEYCRTYTNISQFLTRRNCISPWEREIICLYADNTDSCRGDSGGPVMSKQFTNFYTVAGIVSWGIGCNRKNTPSAYTNVRTYFHWILMHTKNGFYLPRPPPQLNSPTFAYG